MLRLETVRVGEPAAGKCHASRKVRDGIRHLSTRVAVAGASRTGRLFAMGAFAVNTACVSTSYVPAKSPHAAVILNSSTPAVYKDGREYGDVFFGGIEEAFRGNPRAEDEARTAHHLMVGGLLLDVAGLGALVGGTSLVATNGDVHGGRGATGAGLVVGGFVAIVVSMFLVINAPPHVYDAVNIYNDGLRPETERPAHVPVVVDAPPVR
jgi:hypothetical protein